MEKLVPPEKSISNSVYKGRNPGCEWTKNKNSNRSMEWTDFEFSGEINSKKIILKSKVIKVPEFFNRFGYVLSYAHAINCMCANSDIFGKYLSLVELLYQRIFNKIQLQ